MNTDFLTTDFHKQTADLLTKIISTQEYFMEQLIELQSSYSNAPVSLSGALSTRAYAYAYSGLLDESISEFNHLISVAENISPRDVIKLSQQYIKRNRGNDVELAEAGLNSLSDDVEGFDDSDKWFYHYCRACIYFLKEDYQLTIASAHNAEKYKEDSRTSTLIEYCNAFASQEPGKVRSSLSISSPIAGGCSLPGVNDALGKFEIFASEPMKAVE